MRLNLLRPTVIFVGWLALSLSLVTYPLQAQQVLYGEDRMLVATNGIDGKTISEFTANGDLLRQVTVNKSLGDKFITGTWVSNSFTIGVVRRTKRSVTFKIADQLGRSIVAYGLGKTSNIHTILSGDVDNNGLNDLVVVYLGGVGKIILNPGATASLQNFKLPKGSNYGLLYSGDIVRGVATLVPPRSAQAKRAKLVSTYFNGTPTKSVRLQKNVGGNILPLRASSEESLIVLVQSKTIRVINALTGKIRSSYRMRNDDDGVFVGDLIGQFRDQVVIASQAGQLNIYDVATNQLIQTEIEIDLSTDVSACTDPQFQSLMTQLVQALFTGNTQLVQQLTQQLSQIGLPTHCLNNVLGGIGQPGTYVINQAQFISPSLKLAEDTSAASICPSYSNPVDGNERGFLAKNSDVHSGIVILTPGNFTASKADILDYNTLKVRETLRYAGYGNPDNLGFRVHFRSSSGSIQSRGAFIFRATNGIVTRCWKISADQARRGRVD